jgi:putative flippase GtrA
MTGNGRTSGEIHRVSAFTIVGAVGFIVDVSVLYLGIAMGLGLRGGRVVSYMAAVTTTWILNRRFTFSASSSRGLPSEWLRYSASQLGGAAVNLGIYYVLIQNSTTVASHPVIGVGAGSVSGLSINYLVARIYVFRHRCSHDQSQRDLRTVPDKARS